MVMDIVVSSTEQLILGMANRASCLTCSVTAVITLISYGGEPSVPTGIVSQLPSSHLSIHRAPTKLSHGIMSQGWLLLSAAAPVFI